MSILKAVLLGREILPLRWLGGALVPKSLAMDEPETGKPAAWHVDRQLAGIDRYVFRP
ncbi:MULTISPECIES: hypothetical protein [Sphingomonas]|jgi:hypothetical protein|uniref:Uncharacterized protein n=1 Tax=Sphingomonas zeae TaxID=1646122 RepID=A0A7Y6B8G6_9SPHN|nr:MULTISPECIES: hypothetical protein [Sphingomonas]MBB4047323.1 hypothetical protein [Sphingomonas zeae]MDK8185318.1 hypothetical protein [Sphingomonas zeae]MDK8214740.1 hypothetical protein [Sphingomonas sp. UMB7805-LC452B]NUU48466.1 hypothetical protein [Sphingomonas zeae]